jgi:phage tail-like protein
MAKYGSVIYGTSGLLYGEVADNTTALTVSPFTAISTNYKTISITFGTPSGSYSRFIMVRNPNGFPATPDDGDRLIDVTDTSTIPSPYVDTGGYIDLNTNTFITSIAEVSLILTPGKAYYYSIFLLVNSSWQRVGNAIGLSVKNYSTTDIMYDYLPTPYKLPNLEITDSSVDKNDALYNFLKTFGFTFDIWKTQAENIKNRYDVENLHGRLIPNALNQFGLPFEDELGIQQGRRLLKYVSNIYYQKGSVDGLTTFVTAFTGYNVTLGSLRNLLLTLNDGSFEYSLGGWVGSDASSSISQISGGSESPVITPYTESGSPAGYPNSTLGILKATRLSTTGAITFACGTAYKNVFVNTQYPLLANGTSVTLVTNTNHNLSVGQKITITGVVPSGYNATNVAITAINGPNQFTYTNSTTGVITNGGTVTASTFNPKLAGVPVTPNSTYTLSLYSRAKTTARTVNQSIAWYDYRGAYISTSTASGSFNSTSAWTRPTAHTATAPLNAEYAVPTISILAAVAAEVHYVDAVQFEQADSAATYADPRRVDIFLKANRINQILNPGFESVTTSWTATGTSAFGLEASPANTGSINSVKLTANATTSTLYQSSVIVVAGVGHTLSAYFKGSAGTVSLNIDWKNSGGTTISSVTSATPRALTTSFARLSITGTAPSTATTATITFTFAGASEATYNVDSVLFEASSYVQQYFDGATGQLLTSDLLWENNLSSAGRSLYFKNRLSTLNRLSLYLPEYLPIGASYAVIAGKTTS